LGPALLTKSKKKKKKKIISEEKGRAQGEKQSIDKKTEQKGTVGTQKAKKEKKKKKKTAHR